MIRGTDVVVLSHLRWNFVYQRPQHVLSRLAAYARVIFVEEPVPSDGKDLTFEISEPQPNVIVVRPHSPIIAPGFNNEQLALLKPRMQKLLESQNIDRFCAWFYTPMALPLLGDLQPELVIYDCMDALDAFLHAPPELRLREEALLRRADVVFTGGPSLYKRLQGRHSNVHCFPSSVDAKHFSGAQEVVAEPADQESIGSPRLGYFGVIDERIDLPLLDTLARSHPQWQIVMVGPVVKITQESLPRHPNLHYLGQKAYAELPSYLGGWDVCLLPFARNESTKYISPTKTLEYMAAERPIVSTPITDVAEPYGQIVYLGHDAYAFVAQCEAALCEPPEEAQRRVGLMREVLASTSWDNTVNRMVTQIDQAIQRKTTDEAIESAASESSEGVVRGRRPSSEQRPVVVVGAGPTGLNAAYHLGGDGLLLEQYDRVGGWCRSLEDNGFTFDFAGHIMFSNDPYVHELYAKLLGDNVHWQDREAWIYSKNVYTRYPFQGALYGLPPQVIKECIVGAIEARFGSLKASGEPTCGAPASNGHNGNGNGKQNGKALEGDVKDCCGDGILESSAPLAHANGNGDGHAGPPKPRNFEEFIYQVWGTGIAKHFAIPYNRKLWAVPLSEMETSWLGGRVPMPDLEELIEGALQPVGKPMGPNARFGYPLRGGFQALMNGFLPHLQDRLLLNTRVVGVSPARHAITLGDGTVLDYEQLISTMPLPVLVTLLGDEAPQAIREAVARLRHVSVRCVNLGVGREKWTEKHWIYYPEETVFHRIFVQGNASPHCNPTGGFGLTCEITYSPHKPLPCDGDALIQRCIADCQAVGMIREGDPIWAANQIDMPYAYVVYDHARAECVKLIRAFLEEHDILLAGRYSEWEYYNSDHAFIAGKKAAEQALARRRASAKSLVIQ